MQRVRRLRAGGPRLPFRPRGPRRPDPEVGGALPPAQRRGGPHPRPAAPRLDDRRRRPAPRCGRGHLGHTGADRVRFRGQDLRPHRRGHQDRALPAREPRGPPGRDLPQDAVVHGRGHPGHPGQVRRPAAQHAHPGCPRRRPAPAHLPRDPRSLCAPGPPPGPGPDPLGAGGPQPQASRARLLPRDPREGGHAPRGAGAPHRRLQDASRRGAGPKRHRGRDHRTSEELLQHLQQDAGPGETLRGDLRPHGGAHHRRHGARVLPHPGPGAHPLPPDPRPLQGLHRHAEDEHVPVAAHHRHRPPGHGGGGADPHLGDAPHGGDRHRRPLALQVGPGRRGQRPRPADELAAPGSSTGSGTPPTRWSSWRT